MKTGFGEHLSACYGPTHPGPGTIDFRVSLSSDLIKSMKRKSAKSLATLVLKDAKRKGIRLKESETYINASFTKKKNDYPEDIWDGGLDDFLEDDSIAPPCDQLPEEYPA